MRVPHKHQGCAVAFKATPVLLTAANTSEAKRGFITLGSLNVIALKHWHQC